MVIGGKWHESYAERGISSMLSQYERTCLEAFRNTHRGKQKALRATALLLVDEGISAKVVAIRLGVTKESIVNWIDRWKVTRWAMLEDRPRPGRPPKFSAVDRAAIKHLLERYSGDLCKVQFYFEVEHGKSISLVTLRKYRKEIHQRLPPPSETFQGSQLEG